MSAASPTELQRTHLRRGDRSIRRRLVVMATECAMHLGRKLRVSNGTTRLIHVSVDIRIQLRLHDRARIHGLLHHSNYAKTVLPQVKTGSHPLGMSCVNCEIRSTSRLGAKIMLYSSYLQGDFEFGLVQERIHCWGLNPETSPISIRHAWSCEW